MSDKKQRAAQVLRNWEKDGDELFVSNAYMVAEQDLPLGYSTNKIVPVAYKLLINILNDKTIAVAGGSPIYKGSTQNTNTELTVADSQTVHSTSREEDAKVYTGTSKQDSSQQQSRQQTPPPKNVDFYSVLGVSKNATDQEITTAFKKLAHQYHPDIVEGELRKQGLSTEEINDQMQMANEEFQKINAAYAAIGSKKKRDLYSDVYSNPEAKSPPSDKQTSKEKESQNVTPQNTDVVISQDQNNISSSSNKENEYQKKTTGSRKDQDTEKPTIFQGSVKPSVSQQTNPTVSVPKKTLYSSSEQKTGFYESTLKKEAAAISKIDKLAKKIPENIPVVSGLAKFKTKEMKGIFTLSTGIDPETGLKIEDPAQRIAKWAQYEASSVRHALGSVADVLTLSGGGEATKIAETIGGFSKKNGPEILIDNAPKFFSRMAGSTKNLQLKEFFETTAQSLTALAAHPTGRQVLLENVKGWNIWDTVDTELKTKEGLERTLINAQNNTQTLEVWGGSPPDTLGNLVFTLRPTLIPARGRKTPKPNNKALDFKKQMATAGFLALTPSTIESLKKQGHLPPDYRNAHLNFAVKAFMKGVESGDLDKKIDNINYLNSEQTQSLRNITHHLAALEIAFPAEAKAFGLESQNPEVEISRQSASVPLQPNQMGLEIKDNILNPILDKITGKISAPLQTKAKNLIIKGLGKGGAKLVGKQIAIKAGIAAGRKALLAAIGSAIPGLGHVAAFLIDQAIKIVGKVLSSVAQNLKKGAKNLAMVGAGTLALGIMSGSSGLIAAGAGMTGVAAAAGGMPQVLAGVSQAGQTLIYFFTSAVIPSIAIPAVLVAIALPVVVALIVFIINAGAYVVPYGGFLPPGSFLENPYILVEKTASPSGPFENSAVTQPGGLTVTYTITITARREPLESITFDYSCRVVQDSSSPPNCPPINPSLPPSPAIISPVEPFVITYTQNYGSSFTDAFVLDTLTVTAITENQTVTTVGSARIRIGNPPEECPAEWPTRSGYITQGAYPPAIPGETSHSRIEAIDVGVSGVPVYAGHTGVVSVHYDSCLGNHIRVYSSCEGRDFYSLYAHLESVEVSNGRSVIMGERMGVTGNTGYPECSTGPHLHYEFKYTSGGNPRYESGNPPYMMLPYIPRNIPRGCYTTASCATTIP